MTIYEVIHYRPERPSDRLLYRTRVGFFVSREEAEIAVGQLLRNPLFLIEYAITIDGERRFPDELDFEFREHELGEIQLRMI